MPDTLDPKDRPSEDPREEERLDYTPWLEPTVQTYAIFTELSQAGDQSQPQMEQILLRYGTNMQWIEFWGRQGYVAEVVKNGQRHFAVSEKAALALELP